MTPDTLEILSALADLSERQREAVVDHFFVGRTDIAIAHDLGCTPKVVASNRWLGLERMRKRCPELQGLLR